MKEGDENTQKRVLKESVSSLVKENLTNNVLSERITQRHVDEYGVHPIFIGRNVESTALFYQYVKNRIKRVPKQVLLLDPFLYDLNDTLKEVVESDKFGFFIHRISKSSLSKAEPHPHSKSGLRVHNTIESYGDRLLREKMNHIIKLCVQRDNGMISNLNNNMNLTDEDVIKEVLLNVEYYNKQMEKQIESLIDDIKRNFGESFYESTLDFWNNLIKTRVSEKI